MARHLATYMTYVIRCWAEQSSQATLSVYRFTLEIPATGQRFGFTNSEELIRALKLALSEIQTQECPEVTEDPPDHSV